MTSEGTTRALPLDPHRMNDRRACGAGAALDSYAAGRGGDRHDDLSDLLADLMHWCDRNEVHFDTLLVRARGHYQTETAGGRPA